MECPACSPDFYTVRLLRASARVLYIMHDHAHARFANVQISGDGNAKLQCDGVNVAGAASESRDDSMRLLHNPTKTEAYIKAFRSGEKASAPGSDASGCPNRFYANNPAKGGQKRITGAPQACLQVLRRHDMPSRLFLSSWPCARFVHGNVRAFGHGEFVGPDGRW